MSYVVKKSVSVILCFTLLFGIVAIVGAKPVHATNPTPTLTNVDVIDAVSDYVDIFSEYDIDSELLFDIMALDKKNWESDPKGMSVSPKIEAYRSENDAVDVTAQMRETKAFREQLEQEMITVDAQSLDEDIQLRGAAYSGNPPAHEHEQALRLEYIYNILQRDYSAAKYNSVRDKYMSYLYISHFIEDQNYNYGGGESVYSPSFVSNYSHIVSAADKTSFNSFLAHIQHSYMISCMANVLSSYNNISTAITSYNMTRVEIIEYIEEKGAFGDIDLAEAISALVNTGMSVSDAKDAVRQAFVVAEANYGDAEDIQEVTDLIYLTISEMSSVPILSPEMEAISGAVTNCFVGIAEDIFLANMAGGIISGVQHAMSAISKGYTLAAMANLYATLSARRADRLWIYLGFDPLP